MQTGVSRPIRKRTMARTKTHGRAATPALPQLTPGGALAATRRLWGDDSAQGLVEYALLITFTALICLVALRYLGGKTNNTLANAANNLS